ncbi:hypothetical protein FRC08_005375, partial [Ceratobasidium sp. 394]
MTAQPDLHPAYANSVYSIPSPDAPMNAPLFRYPYALPPQFALTVPAHPPHPAPAPSVPTKK